MEALLAALEGLNDKPSRLGLVEEMTPLTVQPHRDLRPSKRTLENARGLKTLLRNKPSNQPSPFLTGLRHPVHGLT